MKKLFTFFWVLLLVQFSIAQQVTVPTDNVNGSSYRQPFGGYYGYERSHMLYTSSEIGTSGNITAISFYVNSVSSPSDSPAEVYLKLSSNTSISASTVADVEAGATLVWSGTIPVASFVADSWVTVTLTTPFAYNTGSNLEVLVKNNAGGAGNEGTLAKRFRHSTTTGTLFQSWNTDNSAPAGTGTVSGSRPNIRLDMTPLAATTVGVSSVVSPASSCNLTASMPITIKIRNNGTGALNNVTIPVFYSINGGAAVAGSFTGTLASGATANYTFPTNANLGTLGTYTFKFWTAMPGDESAADDILQNYSVTKTAPATITPVTFTGYTGGNLSTVFTGWSEGNGQAKPAGTTSSWTNDNAIFGDDVARINLYSTNKKEWIYSPSFVAGNSSAINYKVALRQYSATGQVSLMDSDDSLNVRVSSDCGATWQTVYSITAANAPTALEKTEFSLPLSAYAGQEIRVGFFATEGVSSGTNDYWLILDDIELITLAPNNTGITQIVSPNGSCGLSASTPVTVKIRNFGTTAQTNIPVQYTVNGGTAVTATYTGSLAAGATTEFTFPTTANLSTVGSYTIAAKTLLAGDVDPSNDGSSSTVVKVGAANFTSVSFTGYTGGNLSTVFTGWSEGNGQAKPAGTTSSWTNDNTIFGDDVARINLYSTGKKEWIVSPLFAPNSASAVNYKVALRQYSATGQVSSMDSDDSLNVRVSSDCGATWQTVYSITAANAPTALEKTEFSMPLSAYAGQEIRVGFFATEGVSSGTNDYWLILDDIELITLAPNNTGITQIVSPNGSCGLSASTPVTVKIRNFGTTAQTNIPVQYTVNGGTAVTATYTGSLAAGATTEFTFPTTANLSTVGSYTIAAKTLLAGDVDPSNDGSSSTVVKVGAANFTSVSFTGYTGDNLSTVFTGWSEGNGQAKPAGTTSSWTNDNTIFGDDVARINLYSTGKKEWIVSPLFAPTSSSGVSFKMALRKYSATGQVSSMDSDDSLNVRVSSDCGATWQTVYSITAANAPTALEKTEFSMPIASYAGQEIRVGFFATEGVSSSTSDYWLILDDIQLTELVDANVGVSAIKHPVGKCGLSAATPVTVTLHNNGTASQTNFPVSYNVNGGAAITETFTGTLASGASVNYTFNTTADLSTVGTYALAAWTSLLGDNITDNDSMSATVIKEAPVSLIPVNFTGFTGDNLGTVFAGWSEGRGQTAPTGTISSWTSNTSSYPNDAVASLYMSSFSASKKEWLISPLYIPSATDGLSFKVALRQSTSNTSAVATMDTDDSLNVRVTTDCGATWQTIYSVTAANAPTVLEKSEFIASLTAFAGQEIRIGLFGTEGTSIASGYYILVDDIQIEALVPNNVGITSILAPSGACGTLTNSTVIKVGIKNIGTSAQTSIPVHYSINNGVVVTETFTGNLASGAVTDYTFTTTADFTNIGTYNVVAWTSLAGDVVINNDSADIVYHTGFVPVDFTGFNGTNISTVFPGWSEANGYIYPGGTTSAWGNNSAIFENNTVAYVNLYSTGKNEWFVSPSFKAGSNDGLSFKVALRKFSANGELSAMGSDDTLAVKVSTDCGATWTNIYNITATNAPTSLELTEFAASLAAYAGQNIQVAVVATEGVTNDEEDYNVYLDDVKLILLAPNDLGVKRIISPSSNCGLGNQATISVKLRNFGTASQSNFPVKYSVNNLVVTETFTGTLSAGDSVTYDFSTPASVSSAQVYNITSWTNLDGDANGMNNGASITLTRYGSPLSVVTFANYAFDNVIGEGWSEAIGGTSVQGDSPWKTGGISGNATGRVTLSGDSITAWIVSPPTKLYGAPVVTFKAALRTANNGTTLGTFGADDKVAVMISTDCGATWSEMFALNGATTPALTASLTTYTVDLANYANQEVRIAFKATDGTDASTSCDVHLDDILLKNNTVLDAGAVQIISPPAVMTPSTNYPVVVRVSNYGSSNFSNYNMTAIIGASSYPGFIFNTVPANSTVEVNLGNYTSPATSGVVMGYAYTEVLGDQEIHNDTTYATFAITPVGVKEVKAKSVAIYPNPNKGSFKIDLANVEGKEAIVRLYSTTGQKVYEGSYHGLNGGQVVEVETEGLPTGMYLLNLEVEGQRFVGKVSIQQ